MSLDPAEDAGMGSYGDAYRAMWQQGPGRIRELEAEVRRLGDLRDEWHRSWQKSQARVEELEQAMREVEWMVEGHVTGPDTYAIWQRYRSVLHPDQQEQG